MAMQGPACKYKGCKVNVPYSTRQAKVFCSKKCRVAHQAEIKKAGGSGQAFYVGDDENLERRTAIAKALKGSKAARRLLAERWHMTSIWNPISQRMISL